MDAQDGELPPSDKSRRHEDALPYRLAAIRECFEESGILLATSASKPSDLIELSDEETEGGRKAVHDQSISFENWLRKHDAVPDIDGLIPFTRWLTPASIPKRYTTQMYVYFLPVESKAGISIAKLPLLDKESASEQSDHIEPLSDETPAGEDAEVDFSMKSKGDKPKHVPTPDGGLEHTTAHFLYAREWLDMSRKREIVLFPPQFILLWLIDPFLTPPAPGIQRLSTATLLEQRQKLRMWIETDGSPSWGEKCISPDAIKKVKNQYMIMGLDQPGPELEGTSRKGDEERVVKVVLDKEIERGRQRPRPVEVCFRKDILGEHGKLAKM